MKIIIAIAVILAVASASTIKRNMNTYIEGPEYIIPQHHQAHLLGGHHATAFVEPAHVVQGGHHAAHLVDAPRVVSGGHHATAFVEPAHVIGGHHSGRIVESPHLISGGHHSGHLVGGAHHVGHPHFASYGGPWIEPAYTVY